MSYLSNAIHRCLLQSKYQHALKKESLQNLALSMWQELNYSKIDPSVLSRVMHGKRLFTPEELFVYCKILQFPRIDVEYLFQCLAEDYWYRDGVRIEQLFVPTKELAHLLDLYLKEAEKTHLPETTSEVIFHLLEKLNEYQPRLT